jgi:hypothetical protein
MKLTEIYLREILLKEVFSNLKEILQIDESAKNKLQSLLDDADELLFKPFGITKNDHKKYIITGSAQLHLYPLLKRALGLDQPGDLDLVIPGKAEWDHLKKYLEKEEIFDGEIEELYKKGIYRPNDDIEAFRIWNPPGAKSVSTSEIMRKSEKIDGYNYMSFEDIINYKMDLNRDKEQEIVDLVNAYKEAKSKEEQLKIVKKILRSARVEKSGQIRIPYSDEEEPVKKFFKSIKEE